MYDLDSLDGMTLRPVGKSLDKRSSQSATSIALRYINMKMCRVVLANILNAFTHFLHSPSATTTPGA
jgi:hypothetical protein